MRLILTMALVLAVAISTWAQPEGIDYNANRIVLNGDDWSSLIANLVDGRRANRKFTIVHIGDSHVQPGIVSDEVRRLLQEHYGNGGRGLISPLAMAGTNEPADYLLKSSTGVAASSRLLSSSKPAGMGFTGVAVRFPGRGTTLNIKAKNPADEFYRITLYHSPVGFDAWQGGDTLKGHRLSATATQYVLREMADSASVRLAGDASLYGVRLLGSHRGVVVDCIGNNGATYRSYLGINGFARQLRDLDPQLVIISLGTNEAYGNYSSLWSDIDLILSSIKRECPAVKFLLTTPLETHKKGSRGYRIQTGIATVRDLIINYARSRHVPTWDFYRVGGGTGAANRWLRAGYMNTDHLHLRPCGYHLQGSLLAQALLRLLSGEDDGTDIHDLPARQPEQGPREETVGDSTDNPAILEDWQQNSSTDN